MIPMWVYYNCSLTTGCTQVLCIWINLVIARRSGDLEKISRERGEKVNRVSRLLLQSLNSRRFRAAGKLTASRRIHIYAASIVLKIKTTVHLRARPAFFWVSEIKITFFQDYTAVKSPDHILRNAFSNEITSMSCSREIGKKKKKKSRPVLYSIKIFNLVLYYKRIKIPSSNTALRFRKQNRYSATF